MNLNRGHPPKDDPTRAEFEQSAVRRELAVAAAEKDERLAWKQLSGLHFTQKYRVVASDVRVNGLANYLGQSVLKKRYARRCPVETNAKRGFGFGRLFGLRKVDGEGLLVLLQNVDTEQLALL